jgi:hypothetical protein
MRHTNSLIGFAVGAELAGAPAVTARAGGQEEMTYVETR